MVSTPAGRAPSWKLLLLALLLGVASAVIGLTEPASNSSRGFLVSTIGISAIVLGSRVATMSRGRSSLWRFLGTIAAVLGSVGTALMAYAMVATALLGNGIVLPPLTLSSAHFAVPAAQAAPVTRTTTAPTAKSTSAPSSSNAAAGINAASGTDASAGTDASNATASLQEQTALQACVLRLANVMRQDFAGGPYPTELVLQQGPQPEIALPSGTELVAAPAGARLVYSRSSDGTAWNVVVVGGAYGHVATYDSTVGVVHTQ
jgi:hypothetical protein